jgi:hypothetical protein
MDCPTFGSHAAFVGKSLQNLGAVILPPNIKSLNVERNQIVDFIGFTPSPHLEVLNISNNPVSSLRGIPPLPKLASIHMIGTPYSRTPFYRVSLVMLFGKSLRTIDGEKISGSERQVSVSYPPGCDALVRAGWIVTYPPPAPRDLGKITASLAGEPKVARAIVGATRATPMIVPRKAKPQSKMMDETLRKQEAELARLEKDIKKVRDQKGRSAIK